MKKKKDEKWRKLDNSAKIFPLSSGKKYSTVFRLSAVLTENIEKEILEQAVKKAIKKFKYLKVKLKPGFFWYYLEENDKRIEIEEERDYPCKYIDPEFNNNYLFKVTYFKNKINIDIYHALTDGTSGKDFFKEIIYIYLEIKYPIEFKEEIRQPRIVKYNTEDSYLKNYNKNLPKNRSGKKAYIIKGKSLNLGAVATIHQIIEVDKFKDVCKKHNATITQYLTAVLLYSIYKEKFRYDKCKNPIKICIPVDLRKYFSSKTISNFFSYITVEANIEKDNLTEFDNILLFVKKDFEKKLNEEEISKTMADNVKVGINIITKLIPLKLKEILVRLSYIQIRKYTTITLSNIGRIGIMGKYANYVKYCMVLISPEPVEKIKCSACTFENKMVFTFTTILNDISIEKRFFEFLKEQGLKVEIESNGVLDVIS